MIREYTSDCIHCGFCLPTCPTYVLWHEEMDSPRGRIHLMSARLDGTIELNPTVATHFDRCLGCMACLSSCPSGVRYDRLIESTRAALENELERPLGDRLARGLMFRVLPYPRRMRAALRLAPIGRALPAPRRMKALTAAAPRWRSSDRVPPVTTASGERRGRVGLLTGCVQSAVFSDVNAATARVLAADGFDVVAPPQGCCGALSVHAGRLEEGKAFARALVAAFDDVDLVVVNSSGCGSHLKELGWLLGDERAEAFAAKVRDVGELLAETPALAARHPLPLKVALQDPCHLRHAQTSSAVDAPSARAHPRPRDRRAGRAGHLLRLGGHLQRRPGGRVARARRPQGGTRARGRRERIRECEPRLPRPDLERASAGEAARCRRSTRSSSWTPRSAECRREGCAREPAADAEGRYAQGR